jgi:hypothetical protein
MSRIYKESSVSQPARRWSRTLLPLDCGAVAIFAMGHGPATGRDGNPGGRAPFV